MAEQFLYEDILNTLIELETRGTALYSKLADHAATLETRKLFEFLSGQEDIHRGIYMGLKKDTYDREEVDEDYRGYMTALLDQVFESLLDVETESYHLGSALKKAKHIEMETLVLLSEFKRWLPTVQHDRIDQLMDEERKHLKLLYELESSFKEEML